MGACEQGVGCPVSKTYTDYQFEVPEGCSSVAMTAQKNAGRPLRKSDAGSAQLAAPGARRVVFVT